MIRAYLEKAGWLPGEPPAESRETPFLPLTPCPFGIHTGGVKSIPGPQVAADPSRCRFALVFVLALYGLLLVRNAWVCDDAYITFRTIDNFVHGFGPVYNIGERVQAYTHPLWMFVQAAAYFITGEFFFTSIVISVIFSLLAFLVYARSTAISAIDVALAVTPLLLSRSFIAYSTSGLETPLSYLLVAIFFATYRTDSGGIRTLRWLCILAALVVLNRIDLVLLVLPALAHAVLSSGLSWARRITLIVVTFSPFWLWEGFSLLYYGFPFPNTYYAKLEAGVSHWQLVAQGVVYLLDVIFKDPVVALSILTAIGVCVLEPARKNLMMSFGIILYVSYVVWAGGDFMSGRFLAVPYLVACMVVLSILARRGPAEKAVAFGAILVAVFSGGLPPWQAGDAGLDPRVDRSGFVSHSDKRVFHINNGDGLFGLDRHFDRPADPRVEVGRTLARAADPVARIGPAGMEAFYAGRARHLVDYFGLCDPLLARLPYTNMDWALAGHWERTPPYGYLDTLRSWKDGSAKTRLTDPALAEFYGHLSNVVHGPVFRVERLRDILKMNVGGFRRLIDRDLYQRFPAVRFVPQAGLVPHEGGTAGGGIGKDGIVIFYEATQRAKTLDVKIRGAGHYGIRFYSKNERTWHETEPDVEIDGERPGAVWRSVSLKQPHGFEKVHVYAKANAQDGDLLEIEAR